MSEELVRALEKRLDSQDRVIHDLREDLAEAREQLSAIKTSSTFLEKGEDRAYIERTDLRDSYVDLAIKIAGPLALLGLLIDKFIGF